MKNACYITLFYNWGTVTPVSWIWCLYMNSDFIFYLTIPFEPSRQGLLYYSSPYIGIASFSGALQAAEHTPTLGTALIPLITWELQTTTGPQKNKRETVLCIYNTAEQNIFVFTSFLVIPTNWGSGIKFLATGHTVNSGKGKTRRR